MSRDPNREQMTAVARRLGPLLDEFVFVGGCAAGVLITDPASAPVRATRDVDVIVEATYAGLADLGANLRQLGFREDLSEGAPLCRWTVDGLEVDVMPADASVLGFANRWYPLAARTPEWFDLAADLRVRLISSPCFLATKLEAHRGRGRDYLSSADLGDIIAVLDGRPGIEDEVLAAQPELRRYLRREFARLLAAPAFVEAVAGHLLPDSASQARLPLVLAKMRRIARGE